MRKIGMDQAVALDHLRLVAGRRQLDVEQKSNRSVGIVNAAKHVMRLAVLRRGIGPQVLERRVDADGEVDLGMTCQREVSMERAFWIGLAVYRDDELAAASEELVDGHVLDMAAVREIEPGLLLRHGETSHLLKQAKE